MQGQKKRTSEETLLEASVLSAILMVIEGKKEESCGFFFSEKINGKKTIVDFLPCENVSQLDKKNNFEIAPIDFLKAEKKAENEKMELAGIYHTHLDHHAIPSGTDLKFALPNFDYLILSFKNLRFYDLRLWKLNDKHQFQEFSITIK